MYQDKLLNLYLNFVSFRNFIEFIHNNIPNAMVDIQQLTVPVKDEMVELRRQYDHFLQHPRPLLKEVLNCVMQHKGKMVRPLLTILSAKLFGPVNDNTYHSALTVEFSHTASLIHDDVVDDSDMRRGYPSIKAQFGNKIAVLVGDYILGESLKQAASCQNTRVYDIISVTAQVLGEGELLQMDNISYEEISEEIYYEILRMKTCSLFSACTSLGAISTTNNEEDIQNMYDFGQLIGYCFQIRDDIFDYTKSEILGKPAGNDLREGKLTLPIIYALNKAQDPEMFKMAYKMKEGTLSEDEIQMMVKFTYDQGGIDYARKTMFEFAEQAKQKLYRYPESDVRQALISFMDFVVGRDR